jgi:hypothetical protein
MNHVIPYNTFVSTLKFVSIRFDFIQWDVVHHGFDSIQLCSIR